jgi:stress-induced morphogen
MPIMVRGNSDNNLDQVLVALGKYEGQHPAALIEVYRQNSVSIRVRVVDPDFAGISRADRHEIIWRFLEELPEEVQSQISLLILLTPEEAGKSLANLEFDHPIPSRL